MSNVNESISHHGIPGMKWGIRRFQNKDGSLTPAGRRKAQKLKIEYKSLTGKKLKGKIPNDDLSKKKLMDLSDTQLKDRLTRLKRLKEARDLEAELMSSKGQKVIKSIGKDVLAPSAIEAGKKVMTSIFYNAMAKATGLEKKDIKSVSKEIKKEVKDSLKEIKKEVKDSLKDVKKETDKKDSQDNKDQVNVDTIFIFNNKSYDKYTDKGKNVVKEAIYEDAPSDTNALTVYDPNIQKRGKNLFDDLYK